MALAEVSTLYEVNCRNIPEMLRGAADNIELEADHPDCSPTRAVVVFQLSLDGQVNHYGWGDIDDLTALGIIERGKHELLTAMTSE
jgi:hypothetical protein